MKEEKRKGKEEIYDYADGCVVMIAQDGRIVRKATEPPFYNTCGGLVHRASGGVDCDEEIPLLYSGYHLIP